MSHFKMNQMVNSKIIPQLRKLGRHEWVKWHLTQNPSIIIPELRLPAEIFPGISDGGRQFFVNDPAHFGELTVMYVQSKLLAFGPKILCPTSLQCEAMENVYANLTLNDYEQPFPAILVEIPDGYRLALQAKFRRPCPHLLISYHHRQMNSLILASVDRVVPENFTLFIPHELGRLSIESFLRAPLPNERDYRLASTLFRIAINFGLLLTRYGARDLGPLLSPAQQKQKRRMRRMRNRIDRCAKRSSVGEVRLIGFEQHVDFSDRSRVGTRSGYSGNAKKPHWRRGHFRRQACGVRYESRRLVFVPPCFINSSSFHGDAADTCYTIGAASNCKPKSQESCKKVDH